MIPATIFQVDDLVFRGREPQTPEEISWIQTNIDNVIRLDPGKGKSLAPAKQTNYPISFWQMHLPWCAIPASHLDYLVKLLYGLPGKKFVHCQEGVDRTGLLIAAYRVAYQGVVTPYQWTPEKAYAEALSYGYHRILNQGLNKTWSEWL